MAPKVDAIKRQGWAWHPVAPHWRKPVPPAAPPAHGLMRLSSAVKSACDTLETKAHAVAQEGRAHRYVSLAELAPAGPPAKRPAMRRSTTHTHELRALLTHRLREAETAAEGARDRAEAHVLRWAVRAAWWWLRRRASSYF